MRYRERCVLEKKALASVWSNDRPNAEMRKDIYVGSCKDFEGNQPKPQIVWA